MTKRIFRSIFIAALSVFAASLILIISVLYDYFMDSRRHQLKVQTTLVAKAVDMSGTEYLRQLDSSELRITLISADGTVIFDNMFEAKDLKNHADRKEIADALESGYGESTRFSNSLSEHTLYSAIRLEDGSVLRLSVAQSTVLVLLAGMLRPVCAVFVLAVFLSLILAASLSKSIVKPLNTLNLDEPLSNKEYDELSPLLKRIDSQQRKLKKQSAQLKRTRNEFDAVTGNMNEGLVLINNSHTVLSINKAACRILGTNEDCIGDDILNIENNTEISRIISAALSGKRAETLTETDGFEYQFDASPVITDGGISGAVLLIFDVTEKAQAELMRREFTANVSHELKTPLHSISGYAELLAGGLVKSEDTSVFASKIYSETQRMIRLVEDIIKLSRLDEGIDEAKTEPCDLFSLAAKTVEGLRHEAAQAGVEIQYEGESAVINGVPQQLGAIVFNLCDNAVKYNRKGGSVTVTVSDLEDGCELSVSDTGIGIPAEHRTRIFERFYRVDKSHSKEVGGTGLGLSIVKHAARLHNAEIKLESCEGEGTTVRVIFPKIKQ